MINFDDIDLAIISIAVISIISIFSIKDADLITGCVMVIAALRPWEEIARRSRACLLNLLVINFLYRGKRPTLYAPIRKSIIFSSAFLTKILFVRMLFFSSDSFLIPLPPHVIMF